MVIFTKLKKLIFIISFLGNHSYAFETSINPGINPSPIEFIQIDLLPKQTLSWSTGAIDSRVIVDKTDFAAELYEINPGQEIPKYISNTDKAFYVLEGTCESFFNGKKVSLSKDNSLFVPKNSAIQFKNNSHESFQIFVFYPSGPLLTIKNTVVNEKSQHIDIAANEVQFVDDKKVPFDSWNGTLSPDKPEPMSWRTLIDKSSAIVGNTRIDPGYDVEAHFHTQSQIVIFPEGEGKTRIKGQNYHAITKLSAIYVPSNSIHHTIAMGAIPLKEIYYFPQGPFASIKYNFVDPSSGNLISGAKPSMGNLDYEHN